jgi:hypothetical protein
MEKMKHRVLIEFESDSIPVDFTDEIAAMVYRITGKGCCATMLNNTDKAEIERADKVEK